MTLQAQEQDWRRRGLSPRALLLQGGPFIPERHYPTGDLWDPVSDAQLYMHSHRHGEWGHIHLFLRPGGLLPGLTPLRPGASPGAACHLVAVGLDRDGFADSLFTTNQWVTGEPWYRGDDLLRLIRHLAFHLVGWRGELGRWIEALLERHHADLIRLMEERDAVLRAMAEAHPNRDPFQDRGLEVLSQCRLAGI